MTRGKRLPTTRLLTTKGNSVKARLAHRDRGSSTGSTIVEFALLLPVFSLMLFGMIQFGLAFYGWDSVHNGVQAGARLAAIGETDYSSTDGSTCSYTGTDPSTFASTTVPEEFAAAVAAGGSTDTTTAALYCQVLYEIGTPPGTNLSGSQPAEVNVTVDTVGAGSTVTVCAQIQAQTFTGFFPSIGLSSSSQFFVEDSNVKSYQPYGGGTCPTTPSLAMASVNPGPPTQYSISGGGGISATATLSGSGTNSTGTITFWVYNSGQNGTAPSACSPGDGPPWYNAGSVQTTGDRSYTSENYSPPNAGTYWWYATYSSGSSGTGAQTPCGGSMLGTIVVP